MGNPSLYEIYLDLMAEEGPITLETFLDRILSGEFGPFSRDEILSFVEKMEHQTMASMWTFAEAHGLSPDLVNQTFEQERKRFEKLKERIQE